MDVAKITALFRKPSPGAIPWYGDAARRAHGDFRLAYAGAHFLRNGCIKKKLRSVKSGKQKSGKSVAGNLGDIANTAPLFSLAPAACYPNVIWTVFDWLLGGW